MLHSYIDKARALIEGRLGELSARALPECVSELFACLKGELNRLFTPMFRAIERTERFSELGDAECAKAVNAWLKSGGFAEILSDFPLLTSVFERASDQFANNVSEFLLAAERFGVVKRAQAYASDLHNGGRCAVIFETGAGKYVYKPRGAAADIALDEFLNSLRALGAPHLPANIRPEAWDLGGAPFTIAPFVENTPAEAPEDIRDYYLRCGALLSLAELFGTTDMHGENLIARADSPVPVDIETLLAGALPNRGQYDTGLLGSLMYSHMLPNWALEADENRDIGALTGEGKNMLYHNGAPCPAHAHADLIIRGFTETYDFILARRAQIERALSVFKRAQFRKLMRPTETYGKLCDSLLSPRCLSDAEARDQTAQKLKRAYARDADPAWARKLAGVCASETDAVLRGDIPYFYSYGDERCLRDWRGVVCEDFFALSPVENAVKRLYMLNEADKRAQAAIIEQSLRAVKPQIEPVYVSAPKQVFDILEARAIDIDPCGWIGVDTDDKGRAYLQSIGFDLYGGLMGVLCFYAALYEATGEARVRRALIKRYAPYRAMYVDSKTPVAARADNVNLTHGVGGHILAHAYLARCLADDEYISNARKLFKRFDFDNFADFEQSDVYGGVSGLLAALPYIMGGGDDMALAQIAERLADGICLSAPALTGYAHGAAGCALALASAQTLIGAGKYDAHILRLLNAENETYCAAERNWPDLRSAEKRGFMHGLCSGAPGVAIARARMLKLNISAEARAICEVDLARAREYYAHDIKPLKRDSLCCGNASRTEAEKLLFGEVKRVSLNAAPALFHPLDTDDFPAGLFQGWAGVGYALTRRARASVSGLFD